MIEVPMLAFVITVNQVSAYAIAFFRRAMLLLHMAVLVSKEVSTVEGPSGFWPSGVVCSSNGPSVWQWIGSAESPRITNTLHCRESRRS